MDLKNKKISLRQFSIIFILSILSPAIRLFPAQAARISGGWLTPVIAVVGFIALAVILGCLFKRNGESNLGDLCEKILGKPVGKAVMLVFFVWVMLLAAVYVRFFAHRILISVMPETSMEFLIGGMLLLTFFSVRGGIASIGRLGEFLFNIFMLIFVVTAVLLLFEVNVVNLFPIGPGDIEPIIGSSYTFLSVWGYFLLMFFFADRVNNIDKMKKNYLQTALIICATAVVIIFVTVGALGAGTVQRLGLPFFSAVKNLALPSPLNRLEPVIISIWTITDFMLVTMFTYTAVSLLKTIFNLSDSASGTVNAQKIFAAPVSILIFLLSVCLAENIFELERFSNNFVIPVNMIMCFGLPAALLIVGKLRRVV